MPLVVYKCKTCSKELKKYFSSPLKIVQKMSCECGNGELLRQLSSPSQNSIMVLDNGVQAKEVEVNRNIVDIVEDRDKADSRERGDAEIKRLV